MDSLHLKLSDPGMLESPFADFKQLIELPKRDIIVADKIWLPFSPELKSFQKSTMRTIYERDFTWIQAVRGAGKSYIAARACLAMGMMFPLKFVYTGPTYRQALHYFNYVEQLIYENPLLEAELDGPITHGSMESVITFKNGTTHRALPMGNGQKLRGQRADVLGIDEAFMMEREMYQSHVVPFLLGHREEGAFQPKLIMTTSAEYEDSYAFKILTEKFLPSVIKEDVLEAQDPHFRRKYAVIDINVDDARASGYNLSQDVLDLLLEGANESERQQALYNKWMGVSGQFFTTDMLESVFSNSVSIEYKADPAFEYGLAIDIATQKDGDFFVIHVCKFLPDGLRMAVVNTHWDRGLTHDDMAAVIHEFAQKFTPAWIVMDKGGGGIFVGQSLAKRTLETSKGQVIKITNPIFEWNDYNAMGEGNRILVFNRATDDMIRSGLADDRSRAGEKIGSEDLLVHLMYEGLRNLMRRDDQPLMIPATYNENFVGDYGPESVIHDRLKDSVLQLRHLSLEMREMPDGSKEVVRSKVSKVPSYKWRNSLKDGASALMYAYLLYRIYYRHARREQNTMPLPIITASPFEAMSQFQGMPEHNEGEIYRP